MSSEAPMRDDEVDPTQQKSSQAEETPGVAAAEKEPTAEDVATAARVLKHLESLEKAQCRAKRFREVRIGVRKLMDKMKAWEYKGGTEVEYQAKRQALIDLRSKQRRQRAYDQKLIRTRNLRRERLEALNALTRPTVQMLEAAEQANAETLSIEPAKKKQKTQENTALDDVEIDDAKEAEEAIEQERLNFQKSCYVCKSRFDKLHHFYDQLCPRCAELNWRKRNETAPLDGRVALLTGGRVKIGFEAGKKLLRAGAHVILTTRFPNDLVRRYKELDDFAEWKDRLHVYGLDLRDLKSVVAFCDVIRDKYRRLDIIVNNAAQTVRRPPAYYQHIMQGEKEAPAEAASIVQTDAHRGTDVRYLAMRPDRAAALTQKTGVSVEHPEDQTVSTTGSTSLSEASDGSAVSALMSQIAIMEGDQKADQRLFPQGFTDVTGQQLDLRNVNSWKLKLADVDPAELVETFAINTLAPFILNSRLKPLMAAAGGTDLPTYIVNVSAMEGKFYRHKLPTHPHTNMAKAALNMMTRTSAQDYAKSKIYMTAVDTGWINDENPYGIQQHNAKRGWQTPIDETDAAARILEPIWIGVNEQRFPHGIFLKDYHETEW